MKRIVILGLMLFAMLGTKAFGQEITVTGTVRNASDGETLPGVSVVIQGTTVGTVTDIEGTYEIEAPADAVLVFSFVGMQTLEVAVAGRSEIDVEMIPDLLALEEVLITAGVAGETPRDKMSVSVTGVGREELQAIPSSDISTALQGKVSGATVVSASGNPGQASYLRLRGSTSIVSGQSPLIILDGVMMEGDLADINMDDVETMEVVKGASATALYGSRAGGGAVVITTRRGGSAAEGTTEIRVRNEFGFQELANEVPTRQHHQFKLADDWEDYDHFTKYAGLTYPKDADGNIVYEGGFHPGIQGTRIWQESGYFDQPFAFRNNHQSELMFQGGNFQTNYVSVTHNEGRTRIFTSYERTRNEGIVWGTEGNTRNNIRLNADHWFGDDLQISATTLVTKNDIDVADGRFSTGWGGGQGSAFFDMLFFAPDVNLEMDPPDEYAGGYFRGDGSYVADAWADTPVVGSSLDKYYIWANHFQSDNDNPLHSLYYQDMGRFRRNVMQSFKANYYLTDWLSFEGQYNLERSNNNQQTFQPIGYSTVQRPDQPGYMYKNFSEGTNQTTQFTANIDEDFGDLALRARMSYLYESYEFDYMYAWGENLGADNIRTLAAISDERTVGSTNYETRTRNYFAIVDMDYLDRYIVSGLFRYDGSSLFGEDERWNPYFRVSGAYRLSEEFDIPGVDELRLRSAYGTSGNRPGFTWQYETYSIYRGEVSKATIGNTALRPSETSELEFGLNARFLEMFEFESTYSIIETDGAFLQVPLPAAAGYGYQWQNAANIESVAFEASLSALLLQTPDINWRVTFNYDQIDQTISSMQAPPFRTGPTINDLQTFYIREGESLGVMYGHRWVTSLDQMENQLPDGHTINDYTVNSDGYVIERGTEGTAHESPIRYYDDEGEDFMNIADMNPDFNLTMNNRFIYRNVELNMSWHWKQGGDVYNQTKQWMYRDFAHGDFDQAGKAPNEKKHGSYYQDFYAVNDPNAYFVEDGTYFKLRELAVYYTFQSEALANLNLGMVESIRFGVIGRNLLTITDYSGWDPEVAQVDYGGTSQPTNYMIDMFNYPNFRSFTFNLEVNF